MDFWLVMKYKKKELEENSQKDLTRRKFNIHG
jgi:hypothetical protein